MTIPKLDARDEAAMGTVTAEVEGMSYNPMPDGTCRFCGLYGHAPERCSMVEAIEYDEWGRIKRIELVRAAKYPLPNPPKE